MSPLEFLQRRFDEIGHVTAGSGVTITFAEYTETLQQFSTIRQLVDRLEGELAKTDNELAAAQAEARELRAERDALLDALRQIAEWPDGGNLYGQEKIKRFAQAAIDAAMQRTSAQEGSKQ